MTPRASPRPPRVLVVDAHEEMARTIADGLSERGYEAVVAATSRDAAALLADDAFDALVADVGAPEIDGVELVDVSRRAVADRPAIVMTAYSTVDAAIETVRRGAYHYLTKPFKLDELALFLGRA